MIAYLKGNVIQKGKGFIILLTDQVGYRIEVGNDILNLPIGEEVELYIHTNVSENDIRLMGFDSFDKLSFFQTIISISGIGPKAGLNIISTLHTSDIRRGLLDKDPKVFTKVSGIGKKNAERIILELSSKISELSILNTADQEVVVRDDDELLMALKGLGYQTNDIEYIKEKIPDGPISVRLKEALKLLSR